MTRREEAIKMLEEWAQARQSAIAFAPISMSTSKVLRREADDLLEPILMLMGVDQTPAAHLELASRAPDAPAPYQMCGFSVEGSPWWICALPAGHKQPHGGDPDVWAPLPLEQQEET